MPVVDSQVHIWAADTPERPWPSRLIRPHRPEPFSANDLLREMDRAGVDRAIVVPPNWDGNRNDLALAAAAAHPDRIGVFGRFRGNVPGETDFFEGWLDQPNMFGLRIVFHHADARPWLAGDRIDWFWAEAERLHVPLMLMVDPDQLSSVARIAERHPRLPIALDHMSLYLDRPGTEAFQGFDKLLELARFPNISVKASALPAHADDPYPFRSVHNYLRKAKDAFGASRIFWGSDMTRLDCTYREAVTMMAEDSIGLSDDERPLIMGEAIIRWIGW